MVEEWRAIPGFGGHYEASSLGSIRVKDREIFKRQSTTGKITKFKYKGKVLSPCKGDSTGHLRVSLGVDGKVYPAFVHHLVLLAFVGPRPVGMECCHNNSIPDDNRPENLRWDTHHNNNQDRKLCGRYATKAAHPMAKLTQPIVDAIRADPCSGVEAAIKYGVGASHVSRLRKYQNWV